MTARHSPRLKPSATLRVRSALIVLAAAVLVFASLGQSASARPNKAPSGKSKQAPAGKSKKKSGKSKPKAPPLLPVPQGFVGVDTDGPLVAPGTTLDFGTQLQSMVSNGVQSIRVAFNWAAAQPYSGIDQVPADQRADFANEINGIPADYEITDQIVADAARRHVTVLPTILYAPPWDAKANPNGISTPMRAGPFADYAAALVGRYGPRGSFWRENPGLPKVPIRMWQIWNEPNLSYYWAQPFAKSYLSMLRVVHAAIKRADPGAQVVLGALTNLAWRYIGQIYKAGGRNLFDIVSVNGFTKHPADVILYMRLMRRAMAHYKDGKKPLIATEISWPSSVGKSPSGFDFDTTEAGQARNIATLLPMIGQQRLKLGLLAFYYYTWIGQEDPGDLAFSFAGLRSFHDGQVRDKPALGAFRHAALALEQCRSKGSTATSCIGH